MKTLALLLVLFASPAFGQSAYTVNTTAEQDAALMFWLSDVKDREDGQAVTTAEQAVQFMLDRTLRGYERELAEREDKRGLGDTLKELAEMVNSSPGAQTKIREIIINAAPENRAKVMAVFRQADADTQAALASMFGLSQIRP